MIEFLKAFRDWTKDPMTESVLSAVGVAVFFSLLSRAESLGRAAMESADDAHERIDAIESALKARSIR